jgi:peptidoglycan/LPS O-acetylase OafA/YrhL
VSPVGGLLALVCLAAALASSWFLVTCFGKPAPQGRYVSIDGLRGYLAFGVFIHHIPVWYAYSRTRVWEVPQSGPYSNLGQVAVALFFMITGFLFYSKLIDGRMKPIDWSRLYISRVFRLWPLYLFAVVLVFVVVACLSGGELRVPIRSVIGSSIRWIMFSILGRPDINGVRDTFAITAGVTWSLPYEWFFYCSLPILSFTVGAPAPKRYIFLSMLALIGTIWLQPLPIFMLAFTGGIAASGLVRSEAICRLARRPAAAVLALVCVSLALWLFPTAYAPMPLLLLSVAFAVVACGNTLFGVLVSGPSRMLGDMSYSIYLLQGTILFCAYGLGAGIYKTAELTPTQHCLIGIACVPILVFTSFATYRLIELPAMHRVPLVANWMRARLKLY